MFSFTITSVIQHRLRGPQGVSDRKPAKQATNHPKTRQKRAGSVFTACMSMRTECISAGNSRHSAEVSPVSGVLPIRKRWTDLVLRGRGRLPAAGKPVFSTFRNRVRRRPAITLWQVAGRLTTRFTGDSTRDLTLGHHGHKNAKATIRL